MENEKKDDRLMCGMRQREESKITPRFLAQITSCDSVTEMERLREQQM